jgi:hypothetical protein
MPSDARFRLSAPLFVLLFTACSGMMQSSGPKALALMPGVVNRADNKSLRFALLKYGLDTFCDEMKKRSAPLRFSEDQPSIGRFYTQSCDARIFDDENNKSFVAQFSGFGYGWTNVTQRIGFDAAGIIDYDPDFLLDGSTMYVYFRPKHLGSSSFQAGMVEGAVANAALAVAPAGFADQVGRQIVASELSRGFTVIRDSDGSVDFGLGIIEKGKRPFHPYQVQGSDKVTLANERVEVHANQREFLGPFEVDASGRALYLTLNLDGADALDVMVLGRDAGDPWLAAYVHQPVTTPPPYPPLMADVLSASAPWRLALPVPRGQYYVVLDNTASAGRVAPPPIAFGDRAGLVNYLIQVGDKP